MSDPPPEPAVHVSLHASRGLAWILVLLHGGGAVCVVTLEVPPGPKLLLVAGLVISVLLALRRHALRTAHDAVLAIGHLPGRGWRLATRSNPSLRARLVGEAFVHPRLTMLNFEADSAGRVAVLIPSDAADPDLSRALRVRLLSASETWN